MAHNHHHRGPGHQILGLILVVVNELFLNGNDYFFLHLAAHFLGDNGGGVEVNHLAQGGHNAVFHQALDHLGAGLFHPAGQLAHADLVGDLHGNGGLFNNLQPQAAQTVCLLLLALVAYEVAVPPLLAVAELLLTLGLLLVTAPAAGAAVGHVLQFFIVLGKVNIGGLAGVHHLGLGHPAHGLAGLLDRLRLRLFLGSLRLGGRGLALLLLRLCLLLRGRLRLLLGGLHPLGEDHLNARYRVVLGQILKDQRQLSVLQHLHVVFGGLRILRQNLRDLLGGQAEVLGHLMHSVFVPYITQIKPPPYCDA